MHTRVFAVVLGLMAFGCGTEEELPEVDCEAAAVPAYSEVQIFSRCTGCHSSTIPDASRISGTENINYNTEAAARMHARIGAHEVYEGEMPPGQMVPAAEAEQFYRWALCGE